MNTNLFQLTKEAKDAFIKKITDVVFEKAMSDIKSADGTDTGTFRMIISTENLDRQGDTLSLSNFDLNHYNSHPVVLWGHDYFSLPIGMTDKISVENGQMIAEGKFAPTPEAQKIRQYYEAGMPMAASVGFMPSEFDEKTGEITKYELLEWSMVAVPANADCVRARSLNLDLAYLTTKGIKFVETKITEKTGEIGSPCNMDDGTPGVMADQGDGKLVCVPESQKSKDPDEDKEDQEIVSPDPDELREILDGEYETEHNMHMNGMKAIVEDCYKAISGQKSVDELSAKVKDEFEKCYKAMDTEHTRHKDAHKKMIDAYAEKMASTGTQDDVSKSLKSISDTLEKVYGAVSVKTDGDGAGEGDASAAKGRNSESIADEKAIDSLVSLRRVLREKATEISNELGSVNKAIKEKANK